MSTKISRSTFLFDNNPCIFESASIVSKKEGEGPLASYFDLINDDATFGEKTWEKAESRMQKDAISKALSKAKLSSENIDILFAGDLLNQCVGSIFGIRELQIPFCGLYSACSTMALSLLLSAIFVDNDLCENAAAMTSSHFCSAEKQFRFPLEYGCQRTPTSQWTVTGSGCAIVSKKNKPPFIKGGCIGKIQDLAIKDINNMGAAMAPAAADTIKTYLNDTKTSPNDYDLILTGDLGAVGSQLLIDLLIREKINISKQHNDCGKLIYDIKTQDVHAGGSGCGCSASVVCSYIVKEIRNKTFKNVLFIATGALMSPTTVQQGETIPSIAHLVHLQG
ncbi:MAG: stage V sporulation protein AD [Oscillospiraceae bacterium]